MPSRDLTFNIVGKDQSGSAAFGKVADAGESMTSRVGAGISSLGQKIGGELGEIVSQAGESLEKLGDAGLSANAKLGILGAGTAAFGVALMSIGSGEKAASQQLEAAVEAAGQSMSDFSSKVDEAKSKAEDFGHSGADADNALAKLTETTGDLGTALTYMTLVENLAAAKHEDLAAAAAQVAAVLGGNTKLLKQYGINLGTGTLTTDQLTAALGQLSDKLQGQAAAASNTFTGRLDSLKEHALDLAARFGNDVGPALTFFGTATSIASGVVDIFAARTARMAEAQTTAAIAVAAEGEAAAGSVASNEAAAASQTELAASGNELGEASTLGKGAMMGLAGGIVSADIAAALLNGHMHGVADGIASLISPVAMTSSLAASFGDELHTLVLGTTAAEFTFHNAAKEVSGFADAIKDDGGVLGQTTVTYAANQLQLTGLAKKASDAGINLTSLTGAVTGTDQQFNNLITTWKASGKPSSDTIEAMQNLRTEFLGGQISAKQLADAVNQLAPDISTVGEVAQDSATEANNFATAMQSVTTAGGLMQAALDGLTGNTESADAANVAFKNTLSGVSESVQQNIADHLANARSLDTNTQAGRNNWTALKQQIDAAKLHAAAVAQQTGSVTAGTTALGLDEKQLYDNATAAGLNATQVQALITKYGGLPSDIQIKIEANVEQTLESLTNVNDKLATLYGLLKTDPQVAAPYFAATSIFDYPGVGVSPGTTKGHATGGALDEGWNVLGEHGPEEVFKQGNNVLVRSAAASRPMNAQGGNNYYAITINANGVLGEQQLIQNIQNGIAKLQRQSGGPSKVNIYGS